ncbi:hypothetical protein ABW19_dt0204158 [Dactylella cylindrospora]|nr:hypothetical protein ABW19_dt0204158 [Dactylella cylindrospora]
MATIFHPSYGATSSGSSSVHNDDSDQTLANTPLLPKSRSSVIDEDEFSERSPLISPGRDRQHASDAESSRTPGKRARGIPLVQIISLVLLCSLTIMILLFGFMAPEAAQEYAKKATDIKLNSLSVDSFTPKGIRVRLQAQIRIDSTKSGNGLLQAFGVLAGSVARKVKVGSSEVTLYVPDYPDGLLGTATYPDVVIDLRDGHTTDIDILVDVVPGNLQGIKPVVDDYLAGKIHSLRIEGESDIPLQTGILPLGTHKIVQDIILKEIPSVPAIDVSRLNLAEIELPDQKALGANVTVSVKNDYPVKFTVPPLDFQVLLISCDQEFIEVALASTSTIQIEPYSPVVADVKGVIKSIPFALIQTCPGTGTSPLDDLLGKYVNGLSATGYVRVLPSQNEPGLPAWLQDVLGSVTVPVPVPGGHAFKNILKSFSLTDVHFDLPDFDAEPGSPASFPHLSATVKAIVALPEEMNAPLDVSKVLADADILYKKRKFGEFHFPGWVPATTVQHPEAHELEIDARVENVPMNITDADVFSEVVQEILGNGDRGVRLQADGTADVTVSVADLGAFAIRGIPAKGDIIIKGGKYNLDDVHPRPSGINVVSSTKNSVKLAANVAFNNPTNYTANVPYVNIAIMKNGTLLGNGTIRDVSVGLGENKALVEAYWAPADGGEEAFATGRALLGDYVSGKNTTITVKPHAKSIPSLPENISKALETLEFELPLPHIQPADDDTPYDPENPPKFVESATLHVLSSTGTFVLNNPFKMDTIFMSDITGVASHNGTILGTLNYTYQFAVPPGLSETPKLPVEWSLNGVGYDIVKKAVGGILKIDAEASCNIKLDQWEERLSFEGNGIGAHVKL